MQQSGEPFLLSLLCSSSYTFKPLGHAFPARCPARVLLSRVSLGPFPSSANSAPLAQRSTSAIVGLFAGLFATMEGSDFSCLFFIGFDSSSSRRGPLHNFLSGQAGDLPVLAQRVYLHARV